MFSKHFLIPLLTTLIFFLSCGDDPTSPQDTTHETGTLTDIDGNVYKTIKIGDQWWMAENLKVTHYQNGEAIPNVTDSTQWSNLYSGAYCNYANDITHVATYGRLYNWYAVYDSRNIAPSGWHVPTNDEWKQLEMYLGMSQSDADTTGWRGTDEGSKLKETGNAHWNSHNTDATNECGFTALPGGYRYFANGFIGGYYGLGLCAYFWSSTKHPTEYSSEYFYGRRLCDGITQVYLDGYRKRFGFSIRCMRD
jgi:uncharacterized protein (TIGR02145 family)